MAKGMKIISLIAVLLTICFALLYKVLSNDILFSLAITFGTITYHFTIRLLIGFLYNIILKNKVNYNKRWFLVSEKEMKLYQLLKVKKWKDKMPTYDQEAFDTSKHSWEEIIQTMCQAELVHETIIVFSFLPIIFSIWFGAIGVFIITSILSALFDLMFVIMQRFNRNRILKIKSRLNNKNIHLFE